MTKRFLNQLVMASYTRNTLNPKTVDIISKKLNKQELKAYIRGLKLIEQQKRVYVAVPKSKLYNMSDLKKIFPDKQIIIEENPSLLLGMRIEDNDMVYETSLKERLTDLAEEVDQEYS